MTGIVGFPRPIWCRWPKSCLKLPADLIRTALDLELAEGTVIADRLGETDCIFLTSLYRAERAIAERLLALTRAKLPWGSIDADKAVPWIEQRIGLELAATQRSAVRLALASKVLVITGGPGVGKTTIVNAILRILAAKGVKLLLCAPTGRAAKRLNETTGHEAKTIHRLLEVDPKGGGFKRNGENPLDCDLSGHRRDVDGRCAVDARSAQGGARERCAADRGRYRPTPLGRTRPGPGGHHPVRRCAGGSSDRGVPAGRTRARSSSAPTASTRGSCPICGNLRATAISISCRRMIPISPCRASSTW